MLLETKTVEKPWGRDVLPAPFAAPAGKRIGEIWFVPPKELSQLLVKYIFTSEKLSLNCSTRAYANSSIIDSVSTRRLLISTSSTVV